MRTVDDNLLLTSESAHHLGLSLHMAFTLARASLLCGAAAGFSLQHACAPAVSQCARSSAPQLAADDEPIISAETSRRAVLAALLGAGVGAGATPAFAGYVTSLGIETTKPKDADIDDEILATRQVQSALSNLKTYKSSAASLKGLFDKDTTMNLIPTIRKEFDFSKLRDDLNVVSTVFDDTTQLTVDRISRSCAPRRPLPFKRPLRSHLPRRAPASLARLAVRLLLIAPPRLPVLQDSI